MSHDEDVRETVRRIHVACGWTDESLRKDCIRELAEELTLDRARYDALVQEHEAAETLRREWDFDTGPESAVSRALFAAHDNAERLMKEGRE